MIKYKKEDKELLQEFTQAKVSLINIKKETRKVKDYNKNEWTSDDYNFLIENWGSLSIEEIAEKLKRSINAVKIKATKIGLKDKKIYGDYVTLNQFSRILGCGNIHSYYFKRYLNIGLPIHKVKIVRDYVRVIYPEEFFEWIEKGNNKHLINLENTQKGCFGEIEPEWFEEKRKADKRASEYNAWSKPRYWTIIEDEKLKSLIDECKYSYRDISIMLKRSEGAIKRRLLDLKIKGRPIKADNHNKWTAAEIETVRTLYKKGYKSCIIAEYVPRSALAINGLLERHNYFLED